MPFEFLIFGLTLLGVALLHRHALAVALAGLAAASLHRLLFGEDPGLAALADHFGGEWVILTNLHLLLLGFAALSNQFERSNLPEVLGDLSFGMMARTSGRRRSSMLVGGMIVTINRQLIRA